MFSTFHFVIIFFLVFFIFVVVWFYAFFQANDFSVPTKEFPENVKKVLVIFPHADDELLSCGGLMKQLSSEGKEVNWIILTRGERGNDDAHLDENLRIIRVAEAKKVAEVYGVHQLIQLDYPDYQVQENETELQLDLEKRIAAIQPDLIITYDQEGLYGHPDHIVVSEVITRLVQDHFSKTKLWYVSFPKKVIDRVQLPEEMAEDGNFKEKRSYPAFKIDIGSEGVRTKMKVMKLYRSQQKSYRKSFPIKFLPPSFYISLTPFDYFSEKQ